MSHKTITLSTAATLNGNFTMGYLPGGQGAVGRI
jgi:hypothetical protein